ncbi:PAS domain S-box protein [Paraglaciecola sp.]|uniref:PAS domain S-box protein n=1 Tax=Paraglaciecola sp. TaxID=1920173 RepID=UPI003EF110F8
MSDFVDSDSSGKADKDHFYHSSLEGVLNTVVDGIVTINSQGLILSFNPSAVRIFGYLPEEVIGQNVKMLMPEPYHAEHDGYLHNYFSTGEKQIIGKGREVKAKRKDGSVFPMELGVSEMKIDNEVMFVGTIRDISDRKSAEQALKENQAQLQAIVDNTVDGLITISDTGIVEHYNKACERIFEYSPQEVIGKNVKMLMPDPYHKEHDGYLKNYTQTGTRKIIGLGREVEGKRKSGSTFPLDLSVSEINVHGRRIYSGIVRDISARKKAEDEIKQANAELEEFSYRTSHDLRSPLISSIKLLDLISEAVQSNETDKALMAIGMVQTSLTRLEELVKDILTLTKATKLDEEINALNVSEVINQSLSNLSYMENFDRLDIRLNLNFTNELYAPKSRLILIIENLLSNAIKYQDIGKNDSYIEISTENVHHKFILKVRDNGLGVPKNQQAKLFQMFKRFHPKTAFGSGLGLYMLQKSVKILDGNVTFFDCDDGSLFEITIPIQLSPENKMTEREVQ